MSNHYHLVLTDKAGELPDFMRDLNSLISRALNTLRGFRGENYEWRSYNMVVVADDLRVLQHCAYTEANPCAVDLVRYATQWGGVSSATMGYGEEVEVARPEFGLWEEGNDGHREDMEPHRAQYCGRTECPEVATLRLVRPPVAKDSSSAWVRSEVRRRVRALEYKARDKRDAKGRKVMGMKRVCKMPFRDAPTSRESYFTAEPSVSPWVSNVVALSCIESISVQF